MCFYVCMWLQLQMEAQCSLTCKCLHEAIWLNTAVQKSHITIASIVFYLDDCWSQWSSKYCTYTGCHWWLCCSPLGPSWHGSSWVWLPDSPPCPLTSVVSLSQTQPAAAVAPAASNSATVAPTDRIHTEHEHTKRSGENVNKTLPGTFKQSTVSLYFTPPWLCFLH